MAAPSSSAEAVAGTMRRFRAAVEAGDVEGFIVLLSRPLALLTRIGDRVAVRLVKR